MSYNKSLLELSIKGKDFSMKHVTKTSPQCIVYLRSTGANKKFIETGRTEVIRNSRNPEWSIKVPVVYRFNEWQTLKLEVWDYDICADNELLGETEVDLGALLVLKLDPIKKRLKFYSNNQFSVTGELLLTIEEVLASKQTVEMQFEAKSLPQKDFLGSSDPYLTIVKENFDGTDTEVYKSEVIHKTLEPIWSEFILRVDDLCDCDYHKRIKISCFDWDRHTSDDFIGAVTTSLHELNRKILGLKVFDLKKDHSFSSSNAKSNESDIKSVKRKSFLMKKYIQSCGSLLLRKLHFRQVPTFVEYIRRGGTQIHFMTAIDFSSDSLSFHRKLIDTNGLQLNVFEYIIQSLGHILKYYDYQGLYGGFKLGTSNGDTSKSSNFKHNSIVPYCDSVEDLIRNYKTNLSSIVSSGNRNFAPVITEVLQMTKNFLNGKHYFVFVIITTGSHSDNTNTLEAIVKASAMPLSIIMVGVGDRGFTNLKRLSGDSTCSRGTRTYRDNIQFFQMKNYMSGDEPNPKLVGDLLESIPKQMLEFMESRNYLPQN